MASRLLTPSFRKIALCGALFSAAPGLSHSLRIEARALSNALLCVTARFSFYSKTAYADFTVFFRCARHIIKSVPQSTYLSTLPPCVNVLAAVHRKMSSLTLRMFSSARAVPRFGVAQRSTVACTWYWNSTVSKTVLQPWALLSYVISQVFGSFSIQVSFSYDRWISTERSPSDTQNTPGLVLFSTL